MTQTAHFTRNVTIDKVTGKELSATDWQSTDATFEAVTAPEVKGWTAPKEPVASETVTADTANQTETVKYTGQDSRYNFTFYDADDNKVLYHWDVLVSPLDPDFYKNQAFIVDDLEAKGFDFEKAGYVEDVDRRSTVNSSSVVNGRTVYLDTSVWYFNHGTQVVTPENPKDGVETSKTVTRTINYVDANGKTIAPSVTQTAHFTRNVTIDKVTGKELSATDWQSTDATFEAVATPTVNGWISPSSATSSETVTANTDNQVETVQYKSTTDIYYEITFYDVDDNDKVLFRKTLLQTEQDPKTMIGDTDFVNDTENAGAALEAAGYVNDYDGQFHETGTKTENGRTVYYEIGKLYFHHGTQTVTPENPKDGVETSKTVTRTINYVNADGKTIAPSVTQTAHFTRNVTIDKVTGKELSATDWKSTDATFEAVTSPSLTNHLITLDKSVDAKQVTADSQNEIVNVLYQDAFENAHSKFIDLDDQNNVFDTFDFLMYQDDANALDAFNTVGQAHLAEAAAKGYVYVSDERKLPVDQPYRFNTAFDTEYIFYFKRDSQTVTPENPKDGVETSKTVTRTINYVDADGKTVAPSVTQTAHFTRNVTIDKVTGKELSATDWKSTDATFEAVTSPSIDGMTVDNGAVQSQTVTADSVNAIETVRYTKNSDSSSDNGADKSDNNDADKDKNSSSDNGADKSGNNDADKGNDSSSDKDADKSGDNDADKDKDSSSDKDADKSDNNDADKDKGSTSDKDADKSDNKDADQDKNASSNNDSDKSGNNDDDKNKDSSFDNGADNSGNNDTSSNVSANQSVTSKTTLPATGEESNAATTVTISDVAQTTVNKDQSTMNATKQVETEVPATAKKAQNHTVEIIALTLSSAAAAFWFTRKK